MPGTGLRVLITGADGFVGQGLVAALARPGMAAALLGAPLDVLLLADRTAGRMPAGLPARWKAGDLADPAYLASLTEDPLDLVFHLASLPGAAAEGQPELGAAINLVASQQLALRLARQAREGGPVARVVFASSIAVLGRLGSDPVGDAHPPAPTLSYGAHKWMTEILLADLTRRGEVDAISLRLPGIVARPPGAGGFGSAFMGEIFHAARARTAYRCPVSPGATAWWMSRPTCVAALAHAARLDPARLPSGRSLLLPAFHAPVGAVIEALGAALGSKAVDGINFAPDAAIEALFGRLPPLVAERARAAGFQGDETAGQLVARCLADLDG
ncbi:NAD-dependent epimerase/dehydratase family protein [Pararhodobacter sp.]|uniref:NAD-dependent epimerase/dehydratase family protein n=1 Tax=Pararhodobacter sp. TaxID=2127056 RepID=UPI002FE065E4